MTLAEMRNHASAQRTLAPSRIDPCVVVACLADAQLSTTASAHGWKISTAPKFVSPSRITTLGQANFIGSDCTSASS